MTAITRRVSRVAGAAPQAVHALAVRAAERVSVPAAAAVALPLFRRVPRPRAVLGADEVVMAGADRRPIVVGGRELITYEWGTGAQSVLLVHGWGGRAAQFARMVRVLVGDGIRVLAFDAPAHGESAGRRTDIRDWLGAIDVLNDEVGGFHAMVGHSLGAIAARNAIEVRGVPTKRLVSVSAAASTRFLVEAFAGQIGVTLSTADALADRFTTRSTPDLAELWTHADAVAHPLPEAVEVLVVHDAADRAVPIREGERMYAAHRARAHMVRTSGLGHNRILADEATARRVSSFVTDGLASVTPDPA